MRQRWGDFGIYRNKPSKLRQYLHQKGSDIFQPPPASSKQSMHLSLDEPNIYPVKNKRNSPSKSFKSSSLVELIYTNRKRVATERKSIVARRHNNIAEHPISSLTKSPLQLPLDMHRFRKSQMNLDAKPANEPKSKRTLVINNSPQQGRILLRRISPASRYGLLKGSKSGREKANRSELSIRDKEVVRGDKEQKIDIQRIFNLKPKHKSLYKMSVQLLGAPRPDQHSIAFIQGYAREQKLGKGGFSEVWSAIHLQTGNRYAVKQMDAFNPYQTHLAEITFSTFFFQNGRPKPQFQNHLGIDGLLTMHGYHVRGEKVYVVYQQCSGSLGEFLFDIYEERQIRKTGELKEYRITHKQIYRQMRKSTIFLKNLIEQLAQSLDLLLGCGIVHSDLKTSNVLINLSQNRQYSFKLVDYGSSFFFQNLLQYRLATPEYIPPELVNFLNKQKGNPYNKELTAFTQQYTNISAIDIWGLGCILLEIVHGIPLWLNHQVKITSGGRQKFGYGLLATENRSYSQILERELQMIRDLDRLLIQENNTRVVIDDPLRAIIKGCLQLNPELRLKPAQVLRILSSSG